MRYTLGAAAKATGLTKGAISNAIKKGRISATKDEHGQWSIDPAELHRVYPPIPVQQPSNLNDIAPPLHTPIVTENAALKARIEALEAINRQLEGERDNLREQNTRITALLAAPKADDGLLARLERIEQSVAATRSTGGIFSRLLGRRLG